MNDHLNFIAQARVKAMTDALIGQSRQANELRLFMMSKEGLGPHFYIGITKNAEERLGQHNLGIFDQYHVVDCGSNFVARQVESYFLTHGCLSGGPGGGDNESTLVYVYKKSNCSIP
jgi:hypothetical protein